MKIEKINSICKKTKIQLFLTGFFANAFLVLIYFLWVSEFEIPFLILLLMTIADFIIAHIISDFLRMKPIVILNHFFDIETSRKVDFEINGKIHLGKKKNLAEQNEGIRTFYEGDFNKCIEINFHLLNFECSDNKFSANDCLKHIAMSYFFLNDIEKFNAFSSKFLNSLPTKNKSDALINEKLMLTMGLILKHDEKAVNTAKDIVLLMEKSQPLHRYLTKYLYAVSLFNSDKKEEAKPIFEDIAKTAEKVMIGNYAKTFLKKIEPFDQL